MLPQKRLRSQYRQLTAALITALLLTVYGVDAQVGQYLSVALAFWRSIADLLSADPSEGTTINTAEPDREPSRVINAPAEEQPAAQDFDETFSDDETG